MALNITYPKNLPVSAHKDEIAAAIRDHQVVIVAGETGSGKTTQLPKILLELGRGGGTDPAGSAATSRAKTSATPHKKIAHTQPRRIAARSVAERIAEELETTLGDEIGFQIRFTDVSSPKTQVAVMTDGILLNQMQHDPMLTEYDTIIIDEAHERSLNIDFILGYLTRLLPKRPDLKLVITSATIDSDRFSEHFAAALGTKVPVLEVSGRTFPVEVRYRPVPDDGDQFQSIVEASKELMREGPGDILVFLAGEREIRDAEDALRSAFSQRLNDSKRPDYLEIMPLFSRLSMAEQHRIFRSHPGRRIVLATNIAETSLTVPGIRYVIDPGQARISRFSKSTKVQRLPIEAISQAAANQRAGRCGRVADGICIRLYSEEDFESRPEFTEPEILRTSLASVVLHMLSVGVCRTPAEVSDFPFIQKPDTRAVRDAVLLLKELGGLSQRNRLSGLGRKLARIPTDPRLSRMMLAGQDFGSLQEVIVLAAGLSIQDPRERPLEVQEQADQLHRRFVHPSSDFLTMLNLWQYLQSEQKARSSSSFRRLCKAEFINYLRVREWQDLVSQFRQILRGLRIPTTSWNIDRTSSSDFTWAWDEDNIHKALLPGLLSHIGQRLEPQTSGDPAARSRRRKPLPEYLGARGAKFMIFPGSGLARKSPDFVMAAELVDTSRLFARQVAAIDPAWVEHAAKHLVKYQYSEPHWSIRHGAAMVYEKATVYGVAVIPRRRILLGRIDAETAREMFIQHGLVEGQWDRGHKFQVHNAQVLDEARKLEDKLRRRDVILTDEQLFEFYAERVGDKVVSGAHFDRWWKTQRQRTPHLLDLNRDNLLPTDMVDEHEFPNQWPYGELTLQLDYTFNPGTSRDGLSVQVTKEELDFLAEDTFTWLVPGMRLELLTAMIRSLPKHLRVQLVPAPNTAQALYDQLSHVDFPDPGQSLSTELSKILQEKRGIQIPVEAWDPHDLPAHLRPTFALLDEHGRLLEESLSLEQLRRKYLRTEKTDNNVQIRATPDALTRAAAAQAPGQQTQIQRLLQTPLTGDLTTWPQLDDLTEHPLAMLALNASQTSDGADPNTVLAEQFDYTLQTPAGPVELKLYPCFLMEAGDQGDLGPVRIRVSRNATKARSRHVEAVRHLLASQVHLGEKRVTTRWNNQQTLAMSASRYKNTRLLVDDLHVAAVSQILGESGIEPVLDSDTYSRAVTSLRPQVEDVLFEIVQRLTPVLGQYASLQQQLQQTKSLALIKTVTDIRAWLVELLPPRFVRTMTLENIRDLKRYLETMQYRLQRAEQDPTRDAQAAWQIDQFAPIITALHPDQPGVSQAHEMLHEFRVSVFAQHLKTKMTVSAQRLQKLVNQFNSN